MTDKRVVLSTCGSLEEAREIAQALVERKLAACVNIVPNIESVYRWKGEIESSTEHLLLIKTTEEAFPSLRDAITELHSYEVPECVEFVVTDGSADYLKWIEETVR
jgi:periplasmic divalent cation tolerance protein